MIVLVSGAQKNVGDYLIVSRAKKLLQQFVDPEIVEVSRFENHQDKLELFNKSRAIILGGGPAYTPNVFPEIYQFISDYDKITAPIIPMGLGWYGKNLNQFRFSDVSLSYLQKIHSKIHVSSCRDILTHGILERHAITNVLMTGCPAWYELDSLGKEFRNTGIKKIVITTGASQKLVKQTIRIIRLARKLFPKAEIVVSFHRGILPGPNTPPRKGLAYSAIALLAQPYGVTIKDVSGYVDKIDFYKNYDLHIGYRVHAHLYFLSYRKPSLLINEDGRGLAMGKSLGLPIFDVEQKDLIDSVEGRLRIYMDQDFVEFNKTFSFIDSTFLVMKEFFQSIKG